MLSPEAMADDLEHLIDVIEEVHPDPYAYTSRRTIRRLHRATLDRLSEPASPRTFYREAARLAAAFQDGHTLVQWPRDQFLASMRNGATVLPLSVERNATALRIQKACKSARSLDGRRVSSIQGQPAEHLHEDMQALVSGPPRYRAAQVDDQFPYLAWALGLEAPYRVATTHSDGQATVDTLEGLRMLGVRSCLSDNRKPAFSFGRVSDADGHVVGVMTINSLRSARRVRKGIENALRSIQNRPVDGIVIDLRDNRGGSTATVLHVLAPFTDRTVRLTAQKSWKISDTYKQYLKRRGLGPPAYQRARSGKVIDIEYEPQSLPSARFRYDGPVAMLVGPRTFSAAVKLADITQYYDIAPLVGSETGGRPSGFGEGYGFRLPNSGLRAMASTAEYVRLNGEREGKGVIPDVQVMDLQVGETDLAMQAAIQVVAGRDAG